MKYLWTIVLSESFNWRQKDTKGCPFDCGLCGAHRQISCTVLLEVTGRCNLSCLYCFAAAGNVSAPDPSLDIVQFWFDRVKTAAPACNIQLSGGEPTVRDDLPQIIEMGRQSGFSFIQLNTNGLRLAREKGYAEKLKAAGLASVFLQFDGVTDDVYRRLRGADLAAEKMDAISRCGEAGLGVVLVPMIVPGINDDQLGDILEVGIQASPTVRGIHFQPVSYFGRRPVPPKNSDRITLPEILAGLETQSGGKVRSDDFSPPGCENALCSFHGRFFISEAGGAQTHCRITDCRCRVPARISGCRCQAYHFFRCPSVGAGACERDFGCGRAGTGSTIPVPPGGRNLIVLR
jgi:uncharacterized radical SAM superfamily Fe-S cluster-containing enzyme